ncbi:hypothetical protein VOI54_08835 [Tamlana sp. 2201CG12-4]|uniref:hypothetical protein n=1 Tax=Tamlana sp. 2201CG12-4 TaxID=3112582 RepID=UPI002DB6C1C6|nr:hypothetical protein [Tamlana sp. 2201CG12-4]MEC3907124.1 hypothetical protein [Tamlana sp. 2201CG12-4]
MSFGVVQSAISTIRNNRNLLPKREKLKNKLSGKEGKPFEAKVADASPLELKRIRDKLQKEHREIRIKQLVFVAVIMLILISVFIYYY